MLCEEKLQDVCVNTDEERPNIERSRNEFGSNDTRVKHTRHDDFKDSQTLSFYNM